MTPLPSFRRDQLNALDKESLIVTTQPDLGRPLAGCARKGLVLCVVREGWDVAAS